MDIKQNITERYKLLKKAKEDVLFKEVLKDKCKNDIEFFFNYFLYTDKNPHFYKDLNISEIPFMLFDFQHEFVTEVWDSIVKGEDVFIEKSRQMGITWMIAGIFLYGFIFHNHKYVVLNQSAEEVDKNGDIGSTFEKIRFMIQLLPEWILPPGLSKESGTDHNKYMSISRSDSSGCIAGKSAKPDAGRGGTYNASFLDEMAFMTYATQINSAISAATRCRIMNSTPNGEFNEYFRMRQYTKDRTINGEHIPASIKGLRYHRTEHPFYDQEWYRKATASKTPEIIAQEYEIDYNVAVEGRVYPTFKSIDKGGDVEFGVYEYDPGLPLYISIDNSHGGRDPHAVTCWQVDAYGKLILIDSCEFNGSVTQAAHLLARKPIQGFEMDNYILDFFDRYKHYKQGIFISDPYDVDSTMNDTTIRNEYSKVGIHLVAPEIIKKGFEVEARIMKVRNNMSRVKINETRIDFISAIANARYPKRLENSNSTSRNIKPVHDDGTSHFRTSFEYFVDYILQEEDRIGARQRSNGQKAPLVRQIPNYVTGELNYVKKMPGSIL